jgi:anti-sigma regulatory factor (Ser/Thr protein kinase)
MRAMVAHHAQTAGLEARAKELVSAINEVATNSIRHGGGNGTFRVWQEDSALVCEIRDRGRFDKPLADRVRPTSSVSAPRGLWLANQLCDLVQIRTLPAGTVVRIHMRRRPQQHLRVMRDLKRNSPAVN